MAALYSAACGKPRHGASVVSKQHPTILPWGQLWYYHGSTMVLRSLRGSPGRSWSALGAVLLPISPEGRTILGLPWWVLGPSCSCLVAVFGRLTGSFGCLGSVLCNLECFLGPPGRLGDSLKSSRSHRRPKCLGSKRTEYQRFASQPFLFLQGGACPFFANVSST